jgi:NAD(P)H dehydrogenase (quinone)
MIFFLNKFLDFRLGVGNMLPVMIDYEVLGCRFYSMYGHVLTLAKKVKEGVDSVEGVEGFLFQVPETLPADVLTKMGAPPKDESIPTITSAQLTEADGFLFGTPTRYGMMAAQMKAFFDSTGSHWKTQSLAGKPAGIFVSTGTQNGGQETTA